MGSCKICGGFISKEAIEKAEKYPIYKDHCMPCIRNDVAHRIEDARKKNAEEARLAGEALNAVLNDLREGEIKASKIAQVMDMGIGGESIINSLTKSHLLVFRKLGNWRAKAIPFASIKSLIDAVDKAEEDSLLLTIVPADFVLAVRQRGGEILAELEEISQDNTTAP